MRFKTKYMRKKQKAAAKPKSDLSKVARVKSFNHGENNGEKCVRRGLRRAILCVCACSTNSAQLSSCHDKTINDSLEIEFCIVWSRCYVRPMTPTQSRILTVLTLHYDEKNVDSFIL